MLGMQNIYHMLERLIFEVVKLSDNLFLSFPLLCGIHFATSEPKFGPEHRSVLWLH